VKGVENKASTSKGGRETRGLMVSVTKGGTAIVERGVNRRGRPTPILPCTFTSVCSPSSPADRLGQAESALSLTWRLLDC
jgi:hypothetical protein